MDLHFITVTFGLTAVQFIAVIVIAAIGIVFGRGTVRWFWIAGAIVLYGLWNLSASVTFLFALAIAFLVKEIAVAIIRRSAKFLRSLPKRIQGRLQLIAAKPGMLVLTILAGIIIPVVYYFLR
jgi:hypothetical protein